MHACIYTVHEAGQAITCMRISFMCGSLHNRIHTLRRPMPASDKSEFVAMNPWAENSIIIL